MRSVIDVLDLTVEEIEELLTVARDMIAAPEKYSGVCRGKKLATLFFEPSTRTRMSFEAAMLDLGGSVISAEGSNSSAAKGESVADTARTVGNYVDVIAMRHPLEGASLVAAENAFVPVINAGDGGHCHPTQTLADLLTISLEKGRLSDLTVGICGDLLYGRTVHSLIRALARYENVRFIAISPRELALPDYMRDVADIVETASLEEALPSLDVLYMTRIQRERFSDPEQYERLKDSYILTPEKLSAARADCIVMHPLPRVNEISVAVDKDERACYFKQVRNGKFMRMALILMLLGSAKDKTPFTYGGVSSPDCVCGNPRCISGVERELTARYRLGSDGKRHCVFCDGEM